MQGKTPLRDKPCRRRYLFQSFSKRPCFQTGRSNSFWFRFGRLLFCCSHCPTYTVPLETFSRSVSRVVEVFFVLGFAGGCEPPANMGTHTSLGSNQRSGGSLGRDWRCWHWCHFQAFIDVGQLVSQVLVHWNPVQPVYYSFRTKQFSPFFCFCAWISSNSAIFISFYLCPVPILS
jgi:hypothetical protein